MKDITPTYYYRPDKKMPAYYNKREGKDAGYDIYAAKDIWFLPFQTKKIPTNSQIHIPKGHFGCVTSRSGHAERGWLTHPGTIDHGYCGIISAIQTNVSILPRRIKKGERIAQMIFVPFENPRLQELEKEEDYRVIVSQLSRSDRKDQGYNSSGIM